MAYNDSNKLTYQQTILRQIQKIQDIMGKELRDGSKVMKNLLGEQTIEAEDTRYSFLQSVELLGSLLFPYFNGGSVVKEFDDYCDLCDMELVQAVDDKDFVTELKNFFGTKEDFKVLMDRDSSVRNEANIYFLNTKVKIGRRMFRSLVKLFRDNDFLADESYGEGSGGQDNGMDAEDKDDEAQEEASKEAVDTEEGE